jgi:hypothetical protein
MKLLLQRRRLRSFTISFVSRVLAVFILTSFAVTLLPIANTSAESSMPCCAGKSSEHCDSGLTAPKPRPVITEPMCGLDWIPPTSNDVHKAHSHDSSLLSAETVSHNANADSHPSLATAESSSQPCRMECAACATITSRHQRHKSIVLARTVDVAPPTNATQFESRPPVFLSNQYWVRINPRGPPSELL